MMKTGFVIDTIDFFETFSMFRKYVSMTRSPRPTLSGKYPITRPWRPINLATKLIDFI